MENQKIGIQSLSFGQASHIISAACVAGKKEKEGPLGNKIDAIVEDPMCGMNTWEEAESELQKKALQLLLDKSGRSSDAVSFLFSGDLLGQLIASSFGVMSFQIPFFGLYGACSTFGEAMLLGAMTVAGGYGNLVAAMASSHFAGAEKTFRYPLEYGNQRPFSATWTVTGAGAVLLGTSGGKARISGGTVGKIVDYGLKDSRNMGACMAPAAADTIYQNFVDFNRNETSYDRIITGDLGYVGQTILIDLLKKKGYDISDVHMDCGIEIYNKDEQDTHAGGSGCACSAVTFCAGILKKVESGEWRRILFVPTGALLSTVSFNEGKSVPGIAHGVVIEHC